MNLSRTQAFRDLPIRDKLTRANVASSAVALLLVAGALLGYDLITFRSTMVRKVATEAQLIGYNSASALLFDDREAAAKTLAALRLEPHVLAAAIYRPTGERFASYLRAGMTDAAVLDERMRPGASWHRFRTDTLVVSESINVDGDQVGSVRIVSDLAERRVRLVSYMGIVAGAVLLAILAAVLLSARLQRSISGPILHLVERARVVTEQKNYAIRATPEGNDELGLLVRTFNEMLTQIQARDSALERARNDAEAANRAKDEFLAVVSHELRTPLTPIISWTRLLRGRTLGERDTNKALDVIERNARAQAQLIDDLLDVSRIIAGKVRLDMQQLDLRPLVEAATESVGPAADAKDVRIQTVLDARLGLVPGDARRLQQVLWNLLSNAVKFNARGGRVEVHVQRFDSYVQVAVSDTGQGIRPEFLPHVFDRFRQADSTTTRAHGGLGLGLAIVRHIVELHGGTVRAESAGEGLGATFTVELPVGAARPVSAPESGRTAAAGPIEFVPEPVLVGLRALVVDDEPDTLDTVRAILASCGAEVQTATSAADAFRLVQDWQPEMIISDIGMPGEDGYALIRKVRALPPERGGKTPAVALTAYARIEDRLKVLSAGYQMHVPKPIEPAELVALMASLRDWSVRPTG